MKKVKLLISVSLSLLLLGSCVSVKTTGSGKVPPGKAKKITGSKSAKPYAPGQQKK